MSDQGKSNLFKSVDEDYQRIQEKWLGIERRKRGDRRQKARAAWLPGGRRAEDKKEDA